MATLEFCDKHNMVAYLEKPEGSTEFHQIIDFLTATTASTNVNGEVELTASIDGQAKTITEASLRRHLKLEDNELASPEQTATGKEISNPFMAGSLPKTTKPTFDGGWLMFLSGGGLLWRRDVLLLMLTNKGCVDGNGSNLGGGFGKSGGGRETRGGGDGLEGLGESLVLDKTLLSEGGDSDEDEVDNWVRLDFPTFLVLLGGGLLDCFALSEDIS
ncbi:hypothetical protein Tco_1187933 [Tanacetum coccineum]